MLTEKELNEIRQRCEKAAGAPWKSFIEGRDHLCGSDFIQTQGEDIELIGASEADKDFIANARQDIPKLLAEIDRLKGLNKPDRDNIWSEMYEAAKAVQNDRKISGYVEAGGVAAAIESASGRIYTGVCVDTCSTLGICAERNAVFNMLTNGEQIIKRVLAIMPDGRNGAPCGACRELMVQLMPESYGEIEIMLDYATGRTITLGEITPEWWI